MRSPPSTFEHGRSASMAEPGHIYRITCLAWSRAPVFSELRHARIASGLCHASRTWPNASCLAWVFLPDRWHGLVELHDGDLPGTIARFKRGVSSAIKRHTGRRCPVWQRACHTDALARDDDWHAVAGHLIASPVRAGLVDRVGDYPYWNMIGPGRGCPGIHGEGVTSRYPGHAPS